MTVIISKPRIGILGTAKGPHIHSLAIVLEGLGADVKLIDPKKITSYMPEPLTAAYEKGKLKQSILDLDALLVRSIPGGSLEQVIYRVNVLHRLEKQGLKVINSPSLIEKTVDKFYTTALLAAAGLPVPDTIVTERYDQAMEAVRQMETVVVKSIFGSMGKGMILLEDLDTAHRVFRALELGNYVYYLQKYLPHENEDYRLFVLNDQVIASMRRKGKQWKTNIACGGTAEGIKPDPVLIDLALNTAKVLEADYVGVDIIISQGWPYVIEANGIPGWLGLQSVSEVDVAEALAKYVLRKTGRLC